MRFKEIKCLIPRLTRLGEEIPCNGFLCDLQADAAVTLRFTCRNNHAPGHSNRIEFSQDSNGNVSYRELPPEDQKEYSDTGLRIPAIKEEVAV